MKFLKAVSQFILGLIFGLGVAVCGASLGFFLGVTAEVLAGL